MSQVEVACSPVTVVFNYVNDIRELLIRAKVANDPVALGFVVKFVNQHARDLISRFNRPGRLIVPAPASFWGRVRGRFDVAQMLALELFEHADVYTGLLPNAAFRGKRAGRNTMVPSGSLFGTRFLNNFKNYKREDIIRNRISNAPSILVVDDVMTTGFTMKTLIGQLKWLGAQSVEGLVIASSTSSPARTVNGS